MVKQKKKSRYRKLSDKQIEQKELELLQELYGKEEGEKRYREIQEKVKADLEQSKNESWHEREERKEWVRIERWIKGYQRLTMTELLGIRELFEKNVKKARRTASTNPSDEEQFLEAKAKLDAVVYLINNPTKIEVEAQTRGQKPEVSEEAEPVERYMFSEFKKSYIEHVKTDKAPKTLENVERVFKHFEAFFGDKSISEFEPEDLEKYKASRKGKVRDVTINNEIRTIKAAFQKAVDWGRLKEHPFGKIKQIQIAQKDARPFTKDEFKKLCSVINDEAFLRIVKFAALTGMRRGEILNLKWTDVDITKKKITVVSSDEHRVKHGKMRKIPVNDEVVNILKSEKNDSDYVFTNKQKRLYNGDTVTKKFKNYVRSAKLPDELHFHSLRATFASWLMSQGVSHYAIKQLLGHASVKTTEGYSVYDDENLGSVVSKMNLPTTVEKVKED